MTKEKKVVVPKKLAQNTPAKNTYGKKASPKKDVTPKKVAVKKTATKNSAKSPAKKLAAKKQLMNPSASEIPEEGIWMDFDERELPIQSGRTEFSKWVNNDDVMPVSWFIQDVVVEYQLEPRAAELLAQRVEQAIQRQFNDVPVPVINLGNLDSLDTSNVSLKLVSIVDGIYVPPHAAVSEKKSAQFWRVTNGREFNLFLLKAGYKFKWVSRGISPQERQQIHQEKIKKFFDPMHWKLLAEVFVSGDKSKDNWESWVNRGRVGLIDAAKVKGKRGLYRPVDAAEWWFKTQKPTGVTASDLKRMLVRLLPERSSGYKALILENGSLSIDPQTLDWGK